MFGLAAFAAVYVILFANFYHRPSAVETVFGDVQDKAAAAEEPLDIYLEVLNVDPVRQAIQVRLDFGSRGGPGGLRYPSWPGGNVTVELSDGSDRQDIDLQAGRPTNSRTIELCAHGALENYPFDGYAAMLWIRAVGGKPGIGTALPVRLTTWDEMASWHVTMAPAGGDGLALKLRAERPAAHVFFAMLLFVALILIAASALTIGALTFLGLRKIEAALVGALGAMVFAVPALRNVLPGAPPLGVRADGFVFLWVQFAVAVGLFLFVATWARRGPRP